MRHFCKYYATLVHSLEEVSAAAVVNAYSRALVMKKWEAEGRMLRPS